MSSEGHRPSIAITSFAQLQAFVAAADLESFTKAAERLGVTQPAISILIRRLEQELDATLFHRGGGVFALTDQGQRLLPHAKQAVHAAQTGAKAVRVLEGG